MSRKYQRRFKLENLSALRAFLVFLAGHGSNARIQTVTRLHELPCFFFESYIQRLSFGNFLFYREFSHVLGNLHRASTFAEASAGQESAGHHFLEFFGGSSRMNAQDTSATSPVSYWILKCERNFFGTPTRTGIASAEILFALLIVRCGSRNERPSSNSTSNASSQSR